MKKLYTLLFSAIFLNSIAQTPGTPIGGIVVKEGKNPGWNTLLSLSGGINNPNTPSKTNANVVSGYSLGGNVYIPLFGKNKEGNLDNFTAHFFTIGLNAGVEYFAGYGDYHRSNLSIYNISGQSSEPGISFNNNGNKQNGFKAELGPQANFSFGKITISPILNVAYINLKQKAFGAVQSGSVNGTAYSKEIYSQDAISTSGLAIIPKLRIAYYPGNIGFYLEGNYISGPEINSQGQLFKPQGKANDMGFYSQDQMNMGSSKSISQEARYNSFGFNIGVSIPLGISSRKRPRGKVTKPSDSGPYPIYVQEGNSSGNPGYNTDFQAKPGNSIGGIIVKGGKNPGGNSINLLTNENGEITVTLPEIGEYTLLLTLPDSQGKSISSKGVTSTKNKRKGRTYTAGRKNEIPDQNIQASPGNPIGGIIVKGGKNPGGNSINLFTDENGKVTFTISEAGEYTFQLTTPETSGKSISEKGVSAPSKGKNK